MAVTHFVTLTEIKTAVPFELAYDTVIITDTVLSGIITRALEGQYSKDVPYQVRHEGAGTGTNTYNLPTGDPLAAEFNNNFYRDSSVISNVEYPAGEDPPVYLDSEDYTLETVGIATSDETKIRFLNDTPQASETFYIFYSTLNSSRTVTSGTPAVSYDVLSVTSDKKSAFVKLVASEIAAYLASKYAQVGDSSINADAVNYQSITDRYTKIKKEKLAEYKALVQGNAITGVIGDWDMRLSGSSQNYLTHPRAWR